MSALGKSSVFRGFFKKDTFENEDVYMEMIVARTRLLRDKPFWGVCASNLVLVETDELETLATDGLHIFYNPSFMLSLSSGEREFALAHEVAHCLSEHVITTRLGGRIHEVWNMAGDYMINLMLKDNNIGEFITTLPILYSEKFRDWTTEEIYAYLMENTTFVQTSGQVELDSHIDFAEKFDGDSTEAKPDTATSEGITRRWENIVRQAEISQEQHNQHNGLNAGYGIPSGIKLSIEQLVKPKINWKRILANYCRNTITHGYSYHKPNRAIMNSGITVPGFRKNENMLKIAFALDTSGSVSPSQLEVFMSELYGILNMFESYEIDAWCFGSQVVPESHTIITKHGDNTLRDLTQFMNKIADGGGTDFEANWLWMKDRRYVPDLLLMATDGMPYSSWGWPNYCPTMFFILNPYQEVISPFGTTINYKDWHK